MVTTMMAVIPKVPWTSLDIWFSKGRTFTGPNHFLLDQKKLTQFKCNILFYALNNESRMAKFQAIICHRSFAEIKMLGL
jgi:hypothetical protein